MHWFYVPMYIGSHHKLKDAFILSLRGKKTLQVVCTTNYVPDRKNNNNKQNTPKVCCSAAIINDTHDLLVEIRKQLYTIPYETESTC